MPNPAGNPRQSPASQSRDRYHAILERYHAWCAANGRSFCVELAAFCQGQMGEAPAALEPTNERVEVTEPRAARPPRTRRVDSGRKKPVYTSTGDTHPSLSAAARSLGVAFTSLRAHIYKGTSYFGCLWSYEPFPPSPQKGRAA